MDEMKRVLEVMARLRDPERGCEWDAKQTFETIAPYTIEEAYEVDDAIRRGDRDGLRDELGDLLLQVVFHARIAEEGGSFDFEAVAKGLADKLVRRHPHVFGEAAAVASDAAGRGQWEEMKATERAERAAAQGEAEDPFDGIPLAAPALQRAVKLRRRAARAGWSEPDTAEALHTALHESGDRALAAAAGASATDRHQAIGDLLAIAARLAAVVGVDAERALREANADLEQRMRDEIAARADRGGDD